MQVLFKDGPLGDIQFGKVDHDATVAEILAEAKKKFGRPFSDVYYREKRMAHSDQLPECAEGETRELVLVRSDACVLM